MSTKKTRPGDVFAIHLKATGYAFALLCKGDDFAFFDFRSPNAELPENLQEHRVLFRVYVARDAPGAGRWHKVGTIPLQGGFAEYGRYLHKPVGSSQYFEYSNGSEIPVSIDKCIDLELLAVWFSFHVDDRLDDYFSGRPDSQTIAMREYLEIPLSGQTW